MMGLPQMMIAAQVTMAAAAAEMEWAKILAVLGVMLTGLVAAISIGGALSKAVEASARQPEAADKIRNIFILGAALIEATALYALLVFILS